MSYKVKPEDIDDEAFEAMGGNYWADFGMEKEEMAAIINAAIDAGLVSPPCHFIAYPSGMPVMHEPGEPIQIFPGKCTEPHERHWKGQTE